MSHDQNDEPPAPPAPPPPAPPAPLQAAADGIRPGPDAATFDGVFSGVAGSPGLRRVWELAAPGLPPEVEPFSFVSADLLRHVARALDLAPGQRLADLGSGRGGPGLWLARELGVELHGVDFSPVAVEQATNRAALFGMAGRARFSLGDLTSTGLPDAGVDGVASFDAFHFAADPPAAAAEALRILRPGGRLVLTNWQSKIPDDDRLPPRLRFIWGPLLGGAGFADVEIEARSEWHDVFTGVYRAALDLGDPRGDAALADLQDEARARLPQADLVQRVVVTASR